MARLLVLGLLLLAGITLAPRVDAELNVTFIARRDTVIASDPATPPDPANTVRSNGSGPNLYVGQTGSSGVRRALLFFDLADASRCTDNQGGNGVNDCAVPGGSTVTFASVTVTLNRSPSAMTQTFELKRLTQAWGEGASISGDPDLDYENGGALVQALAGDATWLRRVYNTTNWTTQGGTFDANVSSSVAINYVDATSLGPKTFGNASRLRSDIQGWLASPTTNHGWIMLGPEGGGQSAMQFGAREGPTPPSLTFRYRAPQGSACNIQSDCEAGLFCTDGVCCNVDACTAQGVCRAAGTCQAGSGTCSNPALPNNTACTSDNKTCTRDVCQNGTCEHIADRGGTSCRVAGGECDLAEVCVNGNEDCPVDAKRPNGTPCPDDGNVCTLDRCNGTSNACQHPAGNAGTVCNAKNGVCDVAETCTGSSPACPSDGVEPATTQCRAASCSSATIAILPANCNGTSKTCPAQQTQNCSPLSCTGNACAGSCVNDGSCAAGNYCDPPACLPKKANGQSCSAPNECTSGFCSDGVCCNGGCGNSNPNDCRACNTGTVGLCQTLASGTVCRASQGQCDPAERCDGSSTACPANALEPATTVCRAATCTSGTATAEALCSGTDPACPPLETDVCSPFACAAASCRAQCSQDAHCAPGHYCAGSVCVPKLARGQSCGANNQCSSNFCADGVCCNSACTGRCEACDLGGGTCRPVTGAPRGSRPPCPGDGSACAGTCDGVDRTACFLPGATTRCTPPTCIGGVATLEARCNGSGMCPPDQTRTCSPFACGPTACFGDCTSHAQCAQGYYCAGGTCEPKLETGEACVQNAQCASSFCVDQVCCESACRDQCEACNEPDRAGQCVAVVGDPRNGREECSGDGSICQGECDGALRTACTYPSAGTICTPASCSGGVATRQAECSGAGDCPEDVTQNCAPFGCNAAMTRCDGDCTVDADCPFGNYCAAGICQPTQGLGQSCVAGRECSSNLCVDGFCCDTACTGQCEACDVPDRQGICTAVTGAPHGIRPRCTQDGSACDGSCDGSSREGCSYPGAETQCRAPRCDAGVAVLEGRCIGSGRCPEEKEQLCPAGCSGNRCAGGCSGNANCSAEQYCSAGVCVSRLGNGAVCGGDAQCQSGTCVDGFCCNSRCGDQCLACDVPGQEGFCTPVAGRPHGGRATCGGTGPCAAVCNGLVPAACKFPGLDTACGVGACSNDVATGLAVCNSAGSCLPPATVDCAPYACEENQCGAGCTRDEHCAEGFICEGLSCVVPEVVDGGVDSGFGPDSGLGPETGVSLDSGTDAFRDAGGGGAGGGSSSGEGGSGTGGRRGRPTDGGMGNADASTDAGDAGTKTGRGGDSGCGCRTAPNQGSRHGLVLLLMSLGWLVRRRGTVVSVHRS